MAPPFLFRISPSIRYLEMKRRKIDAVPKQPTLAVPLSFLGKIQQE